MKVNQFTSRELTAAIASRATVHVTRGWAKGMTGTLTAYNRQDDTVLVGFVTMPASDVEVTGKITFAEPKQNTGYASELVPGDVFRLNHSSSLYIVAGYGNRGYDNSWLTVPVTTGETLDLHCYRQVVFVKKVSRCLHGFPPDDCCDN